MSKDHWLKVEQLDTPLCNIFEGTKSKGTGREYVKMAESILGLKHVKLERMDYEQMNNYIDHLARKMDSYLDEQPKGKG